MLYRALHQAKFEALTPCLTNGNLFVTLKFMQVKIIEYIDDQGKSPFARWFDRLDAEAAARISRALYQMEQGNFSNVKGVGKGVFEFKIYFGPGYRIYFGQDGEELVILLGGGTKGQQSKDIINAQGVLE